MWLDCGEHGAVRLHKITPTTVILRDSAEIPACHADLVVKVDGKTHRRRVDVTSGISPASNSATVLPVDNIAPF